MVPSATSLGMVLTQQTNVHSAPPKGTYRIVERITEKVGDGHGQELSSIFGDVLYVEGDSLMERYGMSRRKR